MAQFIALVELCVKYNSFSFEGKEYRQVHTMTTGSPLSPVMACLFTKSFEKSQTKLIIGAHTRYFRYVDDCLVLLPRGEKTSTLLDAINGLHPNIRFTMVEECDERLPFSDMMLDLNDGLEGCLAKARVIRRRLKPKDEVKEETLRVIDPSSKVMNVLNSATGPKVDIIGKCEDWGFGITWTTKNFQSQLRALLYSLP